MPGEAVTTAANVPADAVATAAVPAIWLMEPAGMSAIAAKVAMECADKLASVAIAAAAAMIMTSIKDSLVIFPIN